MPKKEITLAELDQAEAKLRDAKEKARTKRGKALDDLDGVKREVNDLRRDYRAQEEAAGRRTGVVAITEDEGE